MNSENFEAGKINTIYRLSLISTIISIVLIVVALVLMLGFLKNKNNKKIKMPEAVNTSQQKIGGDEKEELTSAELTAKISELANKNSRSVELLSNNLKDIEASLKTQKPIDESIKVKQAEDKTDGKAAKAAFDKARSLWSKGDIHGAEIYFSYAIAKDPNNPNYLEGYSKTAIDWCRQRKTTEDKQTAIFLLENLGEFLRSHSSDLDIKHLNRIQKLLKILRNEKEELLAGLKQGRYQNSINKSETLLSRPMPRDLNGLENYYIEVSEALENISNISLQAPDSKTESISLLLDKKINEIESIRDAFILIEQAKDLLKVNITGLKVNSAQSAYLMRAIDTVDRLISFKSIDIKLIVKEIDDLVPRLDNQIQTLNKRMGKKILHELTRSKEKIEGLYSISPEQKCNDAIATLTDFLRVCEYRISEINDRGIFNKAQGIIDTTNNAIAQWRGQQILYYEKWVMGKVKEFYQSQKDNNGIGGDKDELYNRFISVYGDIDTRYLSMAGARAYNEVFEFFYKELNKDQKIELTAKIAVGEKKRLGDF